MRMKPTVCVAVAAAILLGLVVSGMAQPTDQTPADRAAQLWTQMRRLDVDDKAALAPARDQLQQLIASLDDAQRVEVATAMLARGMDDATAAAALEEFGQDPLNVELLYPIVSNPQRSWPQRVLIRTYYKFLRPEYETRLSEESRRKLLDLLAKRLNELADDEQVSYGEQRLLTHMLQAALSRYSGKQSDVPAFARLLKAMDDYTQTTREDDILAASIRAWVAMNDPAPPAMATRAQTLMAMGHWEPLVRMKAAARLGQMIRKDPSVAEDVMAQMKDPRDEVRAAAASVFSFAMNYDPPKVVPAMVRLLVWDRGVVVQQAAAETLITHSDEAQMAVPLLLDALKTRQPRPGPKRTNSILLALSYLVHERTPTSQKRQLLDLAGKNLTFAPDGALRALESLGRYARPAVPAILKYRNTRADRITRQYIDRHVLQAIDPRSVPRKNS